MQPNLDKGTMTTTAAMILGIDRQAVAFKPCFPATAGKVVEFRVTTRVWH
jgi:hypothetical protein